MCGHGCSGHGQHACASGHNRFPERGWVQFLFLRILAEAPMHGYQLNEEIEKRGLVPAGRLESGSIYTILRRMEHRGLVTSVWERVEAGPDRRVYKVTEEGEETLRAGLEAILRRKRLMDDLASFYQRHFGGEGVARKHGESEDEYGKEVK